MQSQSGLTEAGGFKRFQQYLLVKWEALPKRQQDYAKNAWGVITYKWRWQIALNIPYLVLFCLDRSIPAVHEFDLAVLSSITSKLPIPQFITSAMGLS